jgi:plasmid stabilization system protein ParE
MQKVYKPAVLEMMCSSPYRWWGASEYWREKIIEYLETRNPEEAARQKALSERDSDDRK